MTEDPTALRAELNAEVALRRRFVGLARQLTSTLEHDELINMILTAAAELLKAETASVLELDTDTGELVISFAAGGIAERIETRRVPKGKGIAGWVVEHGESVVVDEPEHDKRFYSDMDEATGFETMNMLAVPLLSRDGVLGVLEVMNRPPGPRPNDLEIAEGLASLAAIALENSGTYANMADAIVQARMSYRL